MMNQKKTDNHRYSGETEAKCVSISSITEEVLNSFAERIESCNIQVDKDLTSLSADVYPNFIHSAVCQLIENAIDSMPSGGELNITLIDGENCWELEVADSKTPRIQSQVKTPRVNTMNEIGPAASSANRSKLELARRAAVVHGGKVQTWNCPQGGTANVLVIPRRQETRKSA